MAYFSRKGSILIAMVLAIVLSITAVSFFVMLTGRATLTANQLKRAQAINCAEAALYETFNRFRVGVANGGWDRTANISNATINVDGVSVSINYNAATHEVSATVDYGNITM